MDEALVAAATDGYVYTDTDGNIVPAPQETLSVIQEPPEPLTLTRQSARRLVIQRLDAEMRMGGIPRRERRRFLFWRGQSGKRAFPISDLARQLVAAVAADSPAPTPRAAADSSAQR